MTGHSSWSFRGRPFLMALALSFFWHALWFFSVEIVVSPIGRGVKPHPKIVSLGPVLDDTIFRTLAENRPQMSQTFYRRLSDVSEVADVETKMVERYSAGDVVSVRFGEVAGSFLRGLVSGSKATPTYEFASRLSTRYDENPFLILGEVKDRQILSRPELPTFPVRVVPALIDSQTELEFIVNPSGIVQSVTVVFSSGDPIIDSLWANYLKNWQFAPLGINQPQSDQKGRVKLQFDKKR